MYVIITFQISINSAWFNQLGGIIPCAESDPEASIEKKGAAKEKVACDQQKVDRRGRNK